MSSYAQDPKLDLRQRIERLDELPALPETAERILRLKDDPNAGTRELAKIIELDPSLAGQIMRYATAPFLGFREKVSSIRDAITRLGFHKVADLGVGFSAGNCFSIPASGPIGLQAFWRHAIYSATLMQMLAETIAANKRPRPGIAYLAGLLHNIGFLLLGHVFNKEFQALSKAIQAQPERPITEIEMELLGITHAHSGVWLMRKWRMPAEIVTAVFEHHNTDYRGDHHAYANLALIADRLLKRHGVGDAPSEDLPERPMHHLGLDEKRVMETMETLMENSGDLDGIADNMVRNG